MSQMEQTPKEWLRAEYERRRARNGRFSMRMFARQIGVSSGRLSELMSGKRAITEAVANKISAQLLLEPRERQAFLECMPRSGKKAQASDDKYEDLSADAFHTLADWEHFAIYNLMDTSDFQPDVQWIGERLNLSAQRVRESMNRLLRLGLISEHNGVWRKRGANITTTHEIESMALRVSHRQSLEQVFTALDEVPLDLRDITSMTMAIDMARMAEAKHLIKKFRRELCAFLEAGSIRTEVYNLNIQLVPVTDLNSRKRRMP